MSSKGSSRQAFFLLMLLLNFIGISYGASCSSGYIACEDNSHCIKFDYICDGDNDCGDNSDEAFCSKWKADGCGIREAKCQIGSRYNYPSSCVSMKTYCTSSRCSGSVDPQICQIIRNNRLQTLFHHPIITNTDSTSPPVTAPSLPGKTNLEKTEIQGQMFVDTLNMTLTHPDCPQLYTRVGDHCLSLFYILKVGWGAAKEFCETIGGELVSFHGNRDAFSSLMKHLRDCSLTSEFWIGGRYLNDTEGWSWLQGDSMEMGSPFWAVRYVNACEEREEETGDLAIAYWSNRTACYHYQQAPRPNTTDLCAAVTFRHYYYITDEDCLEKKSPLCLSTNNSSGTVPTIQ